MTTKPLSWREREMKQYASESPSPTTLTTEEDERARVARNWDEIKKARMIYLRQKNQKGVDVLDAELAAGRGKDFPHDADFDEDADLGPLSDDDLGPLKRVPQKGAVRKPASQGDVRKSEPPMALIEQEATERGWDAANKDFTAKGGVLKPGQTQAQAVAEASGLRNPADTRESAQAQHAADTGELTYGDSVAYNAVKPLAAIGGFAFKGPLGATGAEGMVRAMAIAYNINKAIDKGMDHDQAAQLFVRELSKGSAEDAAWNLGVPAVGHLLSKIPGLNRIGPKIHAAIQGRLPGVKPKPELRDQKILDLQDVATKAGNPDRAKAVDELSKRVDGDYVPTRGQVTGDPSFMERRTFEAFPGEFQAQEKALGTAAEQFRKDVVSPLSQVPGQPAVLPDAKNIGERVEELTTKTIRATKDRLRPVFKMAAEQGVHSDFSKVADVARRALQRPDVLTATERAHLQSIVDDALRNPLKTAESALDFASAQKAMARGLNQNGESTPFYETVLRDMIREADVSFTRAMDGAGKGRIKMLLDAARTDYRKMNEMAYTGAMKQALKKGDAEPSDIGRMLWQNGKVGRIEDLDEMLALARREGVAGSATTSKLRRDVTRGFMQKAVQNVDDAANWSKMLQDPDRAATWAALTKGPDGKALKDAMSVLEQAAQMATIPKGQRQTTFMTMPLSRAAGSAGLGISWVTGAFSAPLVVGGLSIAGLIRLLSTAYVHGDKGTLNLITKVVRSNSTATAASIKALQATVPQLAEAAQKYGIDPFMQDEEQSDEQSEQR